MAGHRKRLGLTRRRLLIGGAAAAAAVKAPAVYAKTKELRFLNDQTSVDSLRALKVAAAQYEKETGVKVTIDTVPSEDLYPRVLAGIRAGRPYDLTMIIFVAHMLSLAKEGHLVPVNDLVKKYKWGKRILFPVYGVHYYYPWSYTMCWLYYRKDLYDQLKLEPAKTWDQFLENARKTATDSPAKRFGHTTPIGSNVATNWMTFGFLWAEGVKLFEADWSLAIASPAGRRKTAAYLDFMAQLNGTMPPGAVQFGFASALQQFGADQAAHAPYAGRMIEYLEQRAPALADKYGIMPYPDSTGQGKAINHGYKGFLVGKTPMSEESLKFLAWWSDAQYINFLHSAPLNFQPPRLDIYEDPRWAAHPLIEKHAAAVKTMRDFLNDPALTIRSIDTEGPSADIRPAKIFESYVLPEMIQNRLLAGKPASECVEQGIQKMRELIA
jgi:multiple sugar transport system substrate-binding protein